MFYVVPVATDDEDHYLYGAPHQIMKQYCKYSSLQLHVELVHVHCLLGYYSRIHNIRTILIFIVASLPYPLSVSAVLKWGHPVATLPSDEGESTSIRDTMRGPPPSTLASSAVRDGCADTC
eukprot:5765157-Pleurochrysis_carterae.AAC.3